MLPRLQLVPGVVTLPKALAIGWGEIEIVALCQTSGWISPPLPGWRNSQRGDEDMSLMALVDLSPGNQGWGEKAVWQASLKERTALSPLNLRCGQPSLGGAGARVLAMRLHCAREGSGMRVLRQCWEPPAEPTLGTHSPGGSCRAELGCLKRVLPAFSELLKPLWDMGMPSTHAVRAWHGGVCVQTHVCCAVV